jgi:hypothetical protein
MTLKKKIERAIKYLANNPGEQVRAIEENPVQCYIDRNDPRLTLNVARFSEKVSLCPHCSGRAVLVVPSNYWHSTTITCISCGLSVGAWDSKNGDRTEMARADWARITKRMKEESND